MKPRLLDHLVCPVDRTPLELLAWESTPRNLTAEETARAAQHGIPRESLDREIHTGALVNRARKIYYPIHQGVPRLLTFTTGVAQEFARRHSTRIAQELPGYALPQEASAPGEQDVLRSFSTEWVNYDWNAQTYWSMTATAWFQAMRFALDLDAQPLAGKLVLEVGTGIGGVADYVCRSEQCELVGMDLGYATDVAQGKFGATNPWLHVVQGSAFAPPFRDATFDFVYSFGVLHHTYSTEAAVASVARLPKVGGRLYVWVYSPFDEKRHLARRVIMAAESVIRPVVWRMPSALQTIMLAPLAPLYMLYQRRRVANNPQVYIQYGWREAMHAARDRFSPRYIHRHDDDEVAAWFRAADYDQLRFDSTRQRPPDVPTFFTACTGVTGVRGPSLVKESP